MKYDRKLMQYAVQNHGLEDQNDNIPLIKENIKKLENIKILSEYPNGKKYTILILSRDTSITENMVIFKGLYGI